ncbi:hypothetical protein Rostov7_00045 [Vibrio phage Rostov 7]|nr:hypothetical protein Rostov7_00045 [Vibrio phage Rostov 7]
MCIKAQDVKRDEHGFWTHDDFPKFEITEFKSSEQWDKWLKDNKVGFRVIWFEDDASEDLQDRYFEDSDLKAVAEWNPACESKDAFLISIHDSEDGPLAVFAIPQK